MPRNISITSVPKEKQSNQPDSGIRDDDTLAFQEAMQGVTPLAPSNRVLLQPQQPEFVRNPANQPESIDEEWSDHIALSLAEGEEWSYLRPGLSRQTLRKLRRGQWKVEAELDMHGMTVDQAITAAIGAAPGAWAKGPVVGGGFAPIIEDSSDRLEWRRQTTGHITSGAGAILRLF